MLLDDPKENSKIVETVTITKKEYLQLLEDSKFLNKLYQAGVDNWEGYEDCLEDD